MEKTHLKLTLAYKGEKYIFTFILHTRKKFEDFVLKYPTNLPPPNGSIEIEVCDGPDNLKKKDPEIVHLAFNAQIPNKYFVCHYAAKNDDEALWIAKFWSRYNLMYLITGNTSVEEKDVMSFELDTDIEIS